MLNKVFVDGRMTRDANVSSDGKYGHITVACEREFKNKTTGNRDTDFIEFLVSEHSLEMVTKYGGKGAALILEGHISVRQKEVDGKKISTMGLVVDNIHFPSAGTGLKRDGAQGSAPAAPKNSAPAAAAPDDSEEIPDDDDLPF